MMMDALRNTMVAASDQPSGYAEGGVVSALPTLPTLQDLANPNFDYSSMGQLNPNIAATSFTPVTQNAPMSVVQGPAYGSMGADVYDWKAPTAQAAPQPYSTVNMEAAQAYNRRVPTAAATANVPMPSVATPAPNVPQAPMQDMAPSQPMAPPAAAVSQPAISPEFTPAPSPLGPDPFEVRRQGAAAELEALRAREEQERVAREAEQVRIAETQRIANEAEQARAAQAEQARIAEAQRQEQLRQMSLENARVVEQRQAEQARQAEEARVAEQARIAEQQRAEAAKRVEAYIAEAPSGATGFSDYSLIGGGDGTAYKDFRSFTSFDDLRSNPLAFDPGSRSLAYTTKYDPGGDNSPSISEVGPDTSWYNSVAYY
jgi:hypothetical protein